MKRKLLIATHSTLAAGISGALELLAGNQESVFTLCAYVDGISEVETPIKALMDSLAQDEELVVLTDVFGGSVNNEFMKYLSTGKLHLISGVNLPLAVEVVMNLEREDFSATIDTAIQIAQSQIRYCNLLVQERPTEENF